MKDTAEKGEVIFKQGDMADCAYFIIKGAVAISHDGNKATVPPFARLGEGEIFGEYALAMIPGESGSIPRRLAKATAIENCEFRVVTPLEFQDRLRKLDPFMRQWIHRIIRRSINVSEMLPPDTSID
jgi:CRP-like cAMP-binding protein